MSTFVEATGPTGIHWALDALAVMCGERSRELDEIERVLSEAADRYAGLGMAASTVAALETVAVRVGRASMRMAAAGEDVAAARDDFAVVDGRVGDAVENAGNLADAGVVTGGGGSASDGPAAGAEVAPSAEADATEGAADAELAERRAKFGVVRPVADLALYALQVRERRHDPESFDEPEDLLDDLIARVGAVAEQVGLGPVADEGTETVYDPEWHIAVGEEPEPGARVVVQHGGQQWSHGGREWRLGHAWVLQVDDERGVHSVARVGDLDEEDEIAVWLDGDMADLPPEYDWPGWYEIWTLQDCPGGGSEQPWPGHSPGETCGGKLLWYGDPDEAAPVHYGADAHLALREDDPRPGAVDGAGMS